MTGNEIQTHPATTTFSWEEVFKSASDWAALKAREGELCETWLRTYRELDRLVGLYAVANDNFLGLDKDKVSYLQNFSDLPDVFGRELTSEEQDLIDSVDVGQDKKSDDTALKISLEEAKQNPDFIRLFGKSVVQTLISFGKERAEKEGDEPYHRDAFGEMNLRAHQAALKADEPTHQSLQKTYCPSYANDYPMGTFFTTYDAISRGKEPPEVSETNGDQYQKLRNYCADVQTKREELIEKLKRNEGLLALFPEDIQVQIRKVQVQIAKGQKPSLETVPVGEKV